MLCRLIHTVYVYFFSCDQLSLTRAHVPFVSHEYLQIVNIFKLSNCGKNRCNRHRNSSHELRLNILIHSAENVDKIMFIYLLIQNN